MANIDISRYSNGLKFQDKLSEGSKGLNHGTITNGSETLEEIFFIRHDSLNNLTNIKLYIDNLSEIINWADTTEGDGILLDLDNDNIYETNISSILGSSLATAINLPDINTLSEKVIRIKIKVPESVSTIGVRHFNFKLEYTDAISELYTLVNQFVIQEISGTEDSNYISLLPQTCKIIRKYDVTEGVKRRNEYGEVITTYTEPQVIGIDIPARIEFLRQRGEIGYQVQIKGGTVFSTHRIFMSPKVNVIENDVIVVGSENYQVQLVERYYDFSNLHHLELFARKVSNT